MGLPRTGGVLLQTASLLDGAAHVGEIVRPQDAFDVVTTLGIALHMNDNDTNLRETGERLAPFADASGMHIINMLRKTENPRAFVAASLITVDVALDSATVIAEAQGA